MSAETKSTLLCGQLQEGLNDSLVRVPVVSGALNYQLCIAAKNKERWQNGLFRRCLYHDDRGETTLVQLCINTGMLSQRSSLQEGCLLVAARKEVAQLLKIM